MTQQREEAIREVIEQRFDAVLAELESLVRIPSVSWPGFDHGFVEQSAGAVAELLRRTGAFETVEIKRAPIGPESAADRPDGQPAVVARRAARNGRPTVLLYAHHDVQPPGDAAEWVSPAFEPTRRDGRMFGRGAADDKAGVMAHVAAIRTLIDVLAADGVEPDLGLAVFIEGEEEWASQSFDNFLRENRDLLAADAIIVADSGNWNLDTPALTVALRGAVAFNLQVSTLAHASHSGMFGGAVPDAMMAAVRLLDSLWDDDGAVAVEGLTSAEIPSPPYDEDRLRAEAGLLDGVRPIGRGEILSRIWAQPALTVTGIDAPSIANASNTLIPSVRVRVSARIAPGDRPERAYRAIRAHLEANTPFGAAVAFEDAGLGSPFLVDTSGWAVEAMRGAMADGWGMDPVDMGVGGSIPFIADLVNEFPSAQILVTGVEDPDGRAHSPNESLHLDSFRKSILTEALFLARLNDRQQE